MIDLDFFMLKENPGRNDYVIGTYLMRKPIGDPSGTAGCRKKRRGGSENYFDFIRRAKTAPFETVALGEI